MTNQYYAIRDNLSELYMTPVLFQNENVALRWFTGVVNSKEQNEVIYNNPQDFELWKLGIFDNFSGELKPMLEKMATGLSVKKREE